MKTTKVKRKTIVGLYTIFTLSLAGSICGTFAWYTYGQRVPVEYEGIAIGDTGSLEVGIVSDYRLTTAECNQYTVKADYSVDGKNIYWAQGNLTGDAMAFFLDKNGYASKYMHPVTAGRYSGPGDNFYLRAPITTLDGENTPQDFIFTSNGRAKKDNWAQLDLVFRCKQDAESTEYKKDTTVKLASAVGFSERNIHKGLRMFIKGVDRNILLNPERASASTLKAGGHLDLNKDNFYDTGHTYVDPVSRTASGSRLDVEIAYGEFKAEDLKYTYGPSESTTKYADRPMTENSTFYSDYRGGSYIIDTENTVYPTIEFEGTDVGYSETIAKADKYKNYYAFTTIIIYLEGWDVNVDNVETLQNFSFDLMFSTGN